MSTRATRGSKRKAPQTPVQKRPPSLNMLLGSAHLPVSWWTKTSILGLFHATNVIDGKSAMMDLTGLLIGPSVWCEREDTKKNKLFTRTKMNWPRRSQKHQRQVHTVVLRSHQRLLKPIQPLQGMMSIPSLQEVKSPISN
jgi:hypothetical protein